MVVTAVVSRNQSGSASAERRSSAEMRFDAGQLADLGYHLPRLIWSRRRRRTSNSKNASLVAAPTYSLAECPNGLLLCNVVRWLGSAVEKAEPIAIVRIVDHLRWAAASATLARAAVA
jgi:hypothetical protein